MVFIVILVMGGTCAALFLKRKRYDKIYDIRITSEQIKKKLDEKFPLTKTYLYIHVQNHL